MSTKLVAQDPSEIGSDGSGQGPSAREASDGQTALSPKGRRPSRRIPVDVTARVERLAYGQGFGPAAIARTLREGSDGGAVYQTNAESIRRLLLRRRGIRAAEKDLRPASLAERMLRILEREILALERHKGPTDLDRLDKAAKTLRALDPLSLKGRGVQSSDGLAKLAAGMDQGED